MDTNNTNKSVSPKDSNFFDTTIVAETFKRYQEVKNIGSGMFDDTAIKAAKDAYEKAREEYVTSMGIKAPTKQHTVAMAA